MWRYCAELHGFPCPSVAILQKTVFDSEYPVTSLRFEPIRGEMPIGSIIGAAWQALGNAVLLLAFSAILFTFIVFVVKGQEAIDAGRRAVSEIRLNL